VWFVRSSAVVEMAEAGAKELPLHPALRSSIVLR